jgi:4-diphosphocytidyl-2-C-methyl-D-erythritol kinase
VPTKDVFSAIGLAPGDAFAPNGSGDEIAWPPQSASASQWLNAIMRGRNDLEPVAVRIQPVIGEVLSRLAAASGCMLSRMSGSGATCFGVFDSDASAARAAASIKSARPMWWVEPSGLS